MKRTTFATIALAALAGSLLTTSPARAGVGHRFALTFHTGLPAGEDYKDNSEGEEKGYMVQLEADLELLDFISLYGRLASENYVRKDVLFEDDKRSEIEYDQWPLDLGVRYGFWNWDIFRWYSTLGVKFAQAKQSLKVIDRSDESEFDVGFFFGTGVDLYLPMVGLHAELLYNSIEQDFNQVQRKVSFETVWKGRAMVDVYLFPAVGLTAELGIEGIDITVEENEPDVESTRESFKRRPLTAGLGVAVHF